MTAVALPIFLSFAGKTLLVVPTRVEFENARVTISIGDIDGAVRPGYGGGQPPLVRSVKPSFGWSSDFLYDRPVGLQLDEQPVFFRCALLNSGVKIFLAAF